MKLLIFDTETTELLNNNTKETCRIVQLSWINYDTNTKTKEENDFVFNTDCQITNSHIHGITTEQSSGGYYFSEICDIFMRDVINSQLLVGHNINYDLNAVEVELDRLEQWYNINILFGKDVFDTMKQSCRILGLKKYPKLTDLYYRFYNKNFDNAHNALEDVRATLQCYLKLQEI